MCIFVIVYIKYRYGFERLQQDTKKIEVILRLLERFLFKNQNLSNFSDLKGSVKATRWN